MNIYLNREFIKEVKRGIKCCVGYYEKKCEKCPYNEINSENCIDTLMHDALKVIVDFEIKEGDNI